MPEVRPRFHLAFPVPNLEEARDFFTGVLGCSEGRSAPRWVDFDFFGHQISAHLVTDEGSEAAVNGVDGDRVPTRHFGLILCWEEWERLRDDMECKRVDFVIKPKVRFEGRAGEQATMFILGPGKNVLEFKSFRDAAQIFAT